MLNSLKASVGQLLKSTFIKNISILVGGTAMAQAFALAAAPLLSRLYIPEAFGVLGLFIVVCESFIVIASGKYELAILLPKSDKEAASLLVISNVFIFITSLLSLIIIVLLRTEISDFLGSEELSLLLWLAPLSILFGGLFNAYNYWITRRKQFKKLSGSKVINSVGKEGSQLLFGLFSNLQTAGLVVGQILGQMLSSLFLIYDTLRSDYSLIKRSAKKHYLMSQIWKHFDFPKFNAPQDFINSVSKSLPIILLTYFFNPAIAGLYWFTHRILLAPNQLIGNSVRQVFYQRANELMIENKNPLGVYLKTTKGLAIIAIIPLIVIMLAGPEIFAFAFGADWLQAGEYAKWLVLWWFFLFINPPSVMMIPIINEQKFQFNMSLISIILRVSAIVIGGIMNNSFIAIALYSIVGAIINITIIYYVYYKLKIKNIAYG